MPHIGTAPDPPPDIIVVLPAYDEPEISKPLEALAACDRRGMVIEIIVVVNHPVTAPPAVKSSNIRTFEFIERWADRHSHPQFRVFPMALFDLPHKYRGVGYARKIGMDEAIYRYEMVPRRDGIIAAFDADAGCTPNYFQAVKAYFDKHPEADALSIYFEHPLEGKEYAPEIYRAIYDYELHLRYYVQAMLWAGHPQAWHTVGSSMAVRAQAYADMGGMNRRQAGEDFYFLHKYSAVGRLHPLNSTVVIPAPRISDKVPFGTGRAIGESVRTGKQIRTYHPQAFRVLKAWIAQIPLYFDRPGAISVPREIESFLPTVSFDEKYMLLRKNTAGKEMFIKRFYQVFDAFFVMKYLHYFRDQYLDNIPVREAATALLSHLQHPLKSDLLGIYRALDRRRSKAE